MGSFGEAASTLNICMTSKCFASSGTTTNGEFNLFNWTPSLSTTSRPLDISGPALIFYTSNFFSFFFLGIGTSNFFILQ